MNTAEWRFWPEGDFRVVTDAELASPLPLVFPFRVNPSGCPPLHFMERGTGGEVEDSICSREPPGATIVHFFIDFLMVCLKLE